ncbi:hypothetical protein CCACVL1_04766 [Corchorus capsularis]|uniref:Uncharacterized protein n=1 Tax=Corchorus capsularis TaxID=210143 RepID=A0A1R3JPT9_COCAP|nr:hypothetical protein CCACVL1_04766 [Corchorus capsularis]
MEQNHCSPNDYLHHSERTSAPTSSVRR